MAFDAAAVATALLGVMGGAAGTKLIEVMAGRRSARVDDASKLTGSALGLLEATRSELASTKVELAATQAEVVTLRDALAETRREVAVLRDKQVHYDELVGNVETLRLEMVSAAREIKALRQENAELRRIIYDDASV